MTTRIAPNSQVPLYAPEQATASSAAPDPSSPLSGAVPAQQPGRSYASAITATQTPPTPAAASAPAQNAKPISESPVNGTPQMAQGGPQAVSSVPNGTPSSSEHGRKPSVVISASGASGYTPNGGPVGQSARPPISFGSMNSQGSPMASASVPYQSQPALSAPQASNHFIPPAQSPSPIPQPPVSGGHRPPSSLQQSSSNGMTFGSMGGDSEQMRQNQMQSGPQSTVIPMHERRQSSQSMQGDMGNMNRNFVPNNGRGRGAYGGAQQPYGAPSPLPNFRQPSNSSRAGPNMPPQFQQQMTPGSPYNRGRNSPAVNPSQPNMAPTHMGGQPMQYGGYPPHMAPPQHPQQGMYPPFDPQSGYYNPYYYNQGMPPSPRPPYPSPYNAPQGSVPGGPPFHPPNMSRSASAAGSERPPSSMGHPQTPAMGQAAPPSHTTAQTPANFQSQPQPASANFVKPKKTSSAIKITDAQGNEVSFGKKPSPTPAASAQPQTPLIVSTPSAPTPPPRAPSNQHVRSESKAAPTQTAEERKNAFQEQVRLQMEERRKNEEAEAAKTKQDADVIEPKAADPAEAVVAEAAEAEVVKEAVVEAEKAAAIDAGDIEGEKDAEAAESAMAKDEDEKDAHEETEDERLEREIAEMEAKEAEEEEREKAYQEKKRKEKEEAAKQLAEEAAPTDEDLKRQEREAEEREAEREREREAERTGEEPDEKSRDMFAALKKPDIGPGASAPASGTETPQSEEAEEADQPSPMPPPALPVASSQTRTAQKPKPANLKLETSKRVEPSEPTPGMQALKSARFLQLKEEPQYPDGFKSPNPALNQSGSRKARAYDKDFLLQFQNIFKEKPSVDWDQKVRETLGPGDEPGSARPQSARTPSSNMGRSASNRPGGPQAMPSFGGPMGSFGGQPIRNLPPGTTSEQRFAASTMGPRPGMGGPMQMGRVPSQMGMGAPAVGMSRTNSLQTMANMQAPGSPRPGGSTRGNRGSRRGGDRALSKKEEAELAAKMPLTAHMEITPLEKSGQGWKASSVGAPMGAAAQHDVNGNLPPDMVQRKVKAALNKMTPEKFDKISDQILEIAAQSKNESDGRTLRQVIQLTFEKACDEAHWAAMYAQFCHKMLTSMSTEIRDETIKDKVGNPVVGGALFRKYLLNRCQEEFERGWQVNLPEKPEGESQEAALLSDEYYIAAAAKRRGLGLIQFIGQLYKLRMLTLRIMHECVQKLLNFEGDPDEAAVENLTTLLKAVGATMEEDESGPALLKAYFERIDNVILKNDKLPSRPRFMIMDLIDLRKAGWKGKDDSKGPKTITQIHEEADAAAARVALENQRQQSRGGAAGGRPPAGRGDARQFSGGIPPAVDYNRTNVSMEDLRRLTNRGPGQRQTGSGLGPGGNLGPGSMLAPRTNSRRGASNLAPSSSGNTTRTNTPPVDVKDKKDEQSSNAFGALATLDPSGEAHDDAASQSGAASPPASRDQTVSPLAAAEKPEESSTA